MAELLTSLWRRLLADPAGTRASLTTPCLIWESPRRALSDAGLLQLTEPGAEASHPGPGEALVFAVARRPGAGNAFPRGVTLGRAVTSDVVLDDTSVSRLHALLQLDQAAGQWLLSDAGSRNGTRLNGLKLEARMRGPVQDGAELTLGDATLRFFSPRGLLGYLEELAQPSKR